MNNLFLISYILAFGLSIISDRKQFKKENRKVKMTAYVLYGLSFILFLTVLFNLNLPVPTVYFIKVISPWIKSILDTFT